MDEEIGIGEVIQSFIDYSMENKYTALPGVVLRVHNKGSQQLLDVQPCVSIKNRDGTETQQSTILNVPYQQPASSLGGVVFPINTGDNVLLVFQMRGIDTWKYGNGGLNTPSDYRMFSNQDCIAIPCVSPVNKAPAAKGKHGGDYDLGDTIVYNGSTEIVQKSDGTTVVNSPNRVIVNSPDVVINSTTVTINASTTNINGDVNISGVTTIQGIEFMEHKHDGVRSGPDTSGGVA